MHYFTADLHINHANVIKYDNRPFENIDQHDHTIIANLKPEEEHQGSHNELWILGDVALSVPKLAYMMDIIRPQWQKIHLIRGNHDDKGAWKKKHWFDSANEALYLRVDRETKVYMSHYAHRVWRNSHHGSLHFHGHSHGALPTWGKSLDVGTMNFGWKPMSLETGIQLTKDRELIHHHLPETHPQP